MKLFGSITVGIDLTIDGRALTDGSQLAVDEAHALASDFDAPVTLVHSSSPDEQWVAESQGYVYVNGETKHVEATIAETVEKLRKAGLTVEAVRSTEPAWAAIVRAALKSGSDLVVVGKRTSAKNDGRRVGSVCHKLLRHCPTAVWAVKPGSRDIPKVMLAATDLTEIGERVIEIATALAQRWQAHLHVVDALQLPFDVQHEGEQRQREWVASERQRSRDEIIAHYDDPSVTALVDVHIGLDSPTNAILEANSRFDPDLVIMGTIGRSGIAGIVVGNTAERLIGRLDCSLLTVKPPGFESPL